MMNTNQTSAIKVWDRFVRIFHWSLVTLFLVAFLSEDASETIHIWAGYGMAGLIVTRLLWGFIGTQHARFSDFIKPPGQVMDYLRSLPTGRAPRYLGHNPAGGAMVLMLLLALVGTITTGMATLASDHGAGPLAGTWLASVDEHTLEEIHEFFANATLALVILHVAGVLFSSIYHRENLVRAMWTGYKASREKHR